MKGFVEYLSEASPLLDKKYRDVAESLYRKLYQSIKRNLDSKNESTMILWNYYGEILVGVNLGKAVGNNKYSDVSVYFSFPRKDAMGNYHIAEKSIVLAILDPKQKDEFFPYVNYNNWKLILQAMDGKGWASATQVRDIFVHELVHHFDYTRASEINKMKYVSYSDGKSEYFNHPAELNAHTQELIHNIDMWFRQYNADIIKTYRNDFIKMYNSAKGKSKVEDAAYYAGKLLTQYERALGYVKNTKESMDTVLSMIPDGKWEYMTRLTPENKKKVYSRLYQYYDEVLRKRFETMLRLFSEIVKRLNNKKVAKELESNTPLIFRDLQKLGLK